MHLNLCLTPSRHHFVVPCSSSPSLFLHSSELLFTFSKEFSRNIRMYSCESNSTARSCRWELLGNRTIWQMTLLGKSFLCTHSNYSVHHEELFIPSLTVAVLFHIWDSLSKPHSWPSAISPVELQNKLPIKGNMTGRNAKYKVPRGEKRTSKTMCRTVWMDFGNLPREPTPSKLKSRGSSFIRDKVVQHRAQCWS